MQNFADKIQNSILIFDGAMGTMIYSRGVFINTCFDELCLSNPALITQIHREYADAGAEVIETNSFGANRIKLREYGLADKVGEINRRAVELAREAVGQFSELPSSPSRREIFIAGSVGPCLKPGQALKPEHAEQIRDAFREQIIALAEAGADLILLETFSSLAELQLAIDAAKVCAFPLIASVTVDSQGETALGHRLEDLVVALENDSRVAALGINCGTGPASAFDLLERAIPLAAKPFIVMPNAGMPREVDGRMIYLSSPEYFTEYARRYAEIGVRGIGGCCGTTPDHIRVMARAIRGIHRAPKHIEVHPIQPASPEIEVVPTAQKSRFARLISEGAQVTSIEILPPKSTDLKPMLAKVQACKDAGIDAINIPDGPRASSRISPMIAAIAIQDRIGIEPVLHYCCRDRNLIGMQSDLMGGYAAGLANFLFITGDPPKLGDYPDATGVFDLDAIGLTRMAANLNHGHDIGGNPIAPPTGIFIGVGANPCALDLDREVAHFLRKVEAGAEFAITQPIFDPEALTRFIEAIEAAKDINQMSSAAAPSRIFSQSTSISDNSFKHIPIIAGVWPLVSYKNAEFMRNEVPGVEVPDWVMHRMARATTREAGIEAGIEIAQTIIQAIASKVQGYQVSAPFGNVEIALRVLGRG